MNYQIISDGSCDLGTELAKEKNVITVPFYVSFDEMTYKKEIAEIGIRDFYDQMVNNKGVYPKSSMPSVQDYIDVFTPIVEKEEAIICICITTKFSGSTQSARTARDMILEDYPNAEITVIDSQIDTVLQGIYVLEAVKLRDEGVPYQKAVKRLEEIRSTGRILFTVGSIDYLQHGGRIGKVAGAAVSVLGIRPMITLKDGEIFSSGIAKGRKKSMDKVVKLVKDYMHECGGNIENYSFVVGYGYDIEEGEKFRHVIQKELFEEFGKKVDVPKLQIGATIAVHTGPYPIGVAVIEKA